VPPVEPTNLQMTEEKWKLTKGTELIVPFDDFAKVAMQAVPVECL